jgi:hypothetical protein
MLLVTNWVQVRHPKVNELIQQDFIIIRYLAYLSTVLPGLKHLQLDKSVQHFAAFMTRQVCNNMLHFFQSFECIELKRSM